MLSGSQNQIQITAPEVSRLNLFQFLKDPHALKIPTYQREYAWGEEQIEALCEDLREFHEADEPYYLLGQLILARNSDEDSASYPLAVVDGQQRITSLLLLLVCLRDALHRLGAGPGDGTQASNILKSISSALEVIDPATGSPRLRVKLAEQGHDHFQRLYNQEALPEIDYVITQQNIRDNSHSVTTFIEKNFPKLDDLTDFCHKVMYRVFVIQTVLEGEEQALDIFEKLNSRGLPLNSADLLKNLLFQQANSSAYESLSKTWTSSVESVFKVKPHKAASMEYVMKAMLGARTGVGTGKRGVYKAWKNKFKSGEVTLNEFAADLEKTAKHLSLVTNSKVSTLNRYLVGCRNFGTVQHLPLVVAGMRLSKNDELYSTLTRLIEARVMTYLFSEEKTQNFEALVWPWASNLYQLDADATLSELISASRAAFDGQDALLNQAKLQFSEYKYTSARDNKRIRFVLGSVTNHLEKLAGEAAKDSTAEEYLSRQKGHSGFQLDHIHPKSQSFISEQELGQHDHSWVHSPGNLVLLHAKDNMSAGAASPELKSKDYASSKLLLTKALALSSDLATLNNRLSDAIRQSQKDGHPDVANWGPEKVNQRTGYLWDVFSKTLIFNSIVD